MEEQIIEVEYDKELVELYKQNYIMEEEGIGAEIGEVFGEQTTFNTDTIEKLYGEGCVVNEITENN